MNDPQALATQREKWRAYFAQSLGGSAGEVDAAADAAMAAIARRADRDGVVAAGQEAARRYREGYRGPAAASGAATAAARPAAQQQVNGLAAGTAVVTALQQRQEVYGRTPFQVWNFRLQRPGESPIPVEIRARSISGQLANGDIVRIPGKKNPMRLVNVTTGVKIVARGRRHRILHGIFLTIFMIVFLIVLAIIVVNALNISSQG